MSRNKLETREELTRHYIDQAMNGPGTVMIEKLIKEVELVVDSIMRAREADLTGEFYLALEDELTKGE